MDGAYLVGVARCIGPLTMRNIGPLEVVHRPPNWASIAIIIF
jgi:hypothetical protein